MYDKWQVPCLRVRVSQHEKPGDHRLCRRLKMTNSVGHLGSPLTHPAPRRGPPREARAPVMSDRPLGVTGPIAGHQPWFLVNVVSNTWSDTQHSAKIFQHATCCGVEYGRNHQLKHIIHQFSGDSPFGALRWKTYGGWTHHEKYEVFFVHLICLGPNLHRDDVQQARVGVIQTLSGIIFQ